MLISEKIFIVRSSMKIDEKRFGNLFRLDTKTIHDWEKGYVIPRRNELRLISRYTRISIDVFLDKAKAIKFVDNKLIVEDDPNGATETKIIIGDPVLEDYPREDNARYEERD